MKNLLDFGKHVIAEIEFDECGQLQDPRDVLYKVMTDHQTLQIAQIDKFEAFAIVIKILIIVIKHAYIFITEHQRGDLIKLFTHH